MKNPYDTPEQKRLALLRRIKTATQKEQSLEDELGMAKQCILELEAELQKRKPRPQPLRVTPGAPQLDF